MVFVLVLEVGIVFSWWLGSGSWRCVGMGGCVGGGSGSLCCCGCRIIIRVFVCDVELL